MLGYYIRTSIQQALRYKIQTGLVVLGVAIGVANIILLISMTDMGRRKTLGLINDFGARMLIVTPFIDLSSGPFAMASPANTNGLISNEMLAAIKTGAFIDTTAQGGAAAILLQPGYVSLLAGELPPSAASPAAGAPADPAAGGLDAAEPDAGSDDAAEPEGYIVTTLAGMNPEFVRMGAHKVQEGRWFSDEEQQGAALVCCLGVRPLQSLFGSADAAGRHQPVDPAAALGAQVLIKGRLFRVIGVMERKGKVGLEDFDNRVFIPLSTAQELAGLDGAQVIFLRYRADLEEEEARRQLQQTLAETVADGEDVDELVSIFSVKEATALMDSTLGIFRAVLAGIGSIALVVAGISIMNVMLIRVLQRRSEIGLRRACGASRRAVVSQFLIEAVTQALGGAVLGIGIGIGGLAIFCRYGEWDFYVSPGTVLLAVGFAFGIGALFGAYPAWRAAVVDPIESLRSEI